MLKLIKKEFALALHPTAIIFLFFSFFVFIPNYPYEMMFFFAGLSAFFICLSARENNDLFFTCSLPIKKGDAAKARIMTIAIFQIALLILAAILTAIKSAVLPEANAAGLDANAAFVGMGAIILGVFNIIFFPMHYKSPNKVGMPFLIASIAIFLIIIMEIVLCYAVPFVRGCIDTYNLDYIWYRFAVLGVGIITYFALTTAACKLSAKRLQAVDL